MGSVEPVRPRAKNRLIFYVAAGYFIAVAVCISTFLPVEAAIQAGLDNRPVLSAVQHCLETIPYVARVKAAMSHQGYDPAAVSDKVRFLSMSYFIMLAAYGASLLAVSALYCLGGRNKAQQKVPWSSAALIGVAIFAAIDAAFFLFALHGFGDMPEEDPTSPIDYIASNNGFILINLALMSASLLTSLVIARFVTATSPRSAA